MTDYHALDERLLAAVAEAMAEPDTTPQGRASAALSLWQKQRAAGIAPENRRIPSPANDSFEQDLEVLRQLMERKS